MEEAAVQRDEAQERAGRSATVRRKYSTLERVGAPDVRSQRLAIRISGEGAKTVPALAMGWPR